MSTINSSDPEIWPVAQTISNTGHSILFMTIKPHRHLLKLLTREVLEIPPSEPWMAMLRFGMGLCVLPWVMDI